MNRRGFIRSTLVACAVVAGSLRLSTGRLPDVEGEPETVSDEPNTVTINVTGIDDKDRVFLLPIDKDGYVESTELVETVVHTATTTTIVTAPSADSFLKT